MERPFAIIYPMDYFPVQNEDQMSMIKLFISDLAGFLDVPKTEVSISALWNKNPPSEAGNLSVQEFLKDLAVDAYYHDFYHSTDDFRAKYWEKYHKQPYATPFNRWRWNLEKVVTAAQHREGTNRLAVYKNWFLNVVMRSTEQQSLLILPIANVQPNYRDSPPPKPTVQEGFDQLFVPSILGASDMVIPLGEVPYLSQITGREEHLAVGIDVVGLPHSDLSLLRTIQGCLKASNRPLRVSTGARIFDPEAMGADI